MKRWKSNAARLIGTSHIEDNLPCQDDVITKNKNNVSTIVLSDGCGSAKFSEDGSKLLVNFVSEYLCNNFEHLYELDDIEIKKEITRATLDEVIKLKNKSYIVDFFKSSAGKKYVDRFSNSDMKRRLNNRQFQDLMVEMLFDATLEFVAVKDSRALIGHCGDGFILGYKDDEFYVLSEEKKAGARNETTYLSGVNAYAIAYGESEWNDFRINRLDKNNYVGFILMSDGAEASLVRIGEKSIPSKQNNSILIECVKNYSKEEAYAELMNLLENYYREYTTESGVIQITDDDVSVAVMVLTDSDNAEDVNEIPWRKRLTTVLSGDQDEEDKCKYIMAIADYTIKKYKNLDFNLNKWEEDITEKFNCDELDIIMIKDTFVLIGIMNANYSLNWERINRA